MINQIIEPTLVIDKKKCLSNISKMTLKASSNNLIFRPHFKTHQSRKIGELYRNFGISKIAVSSISMAKYFSEAGWTNITVAFPLNPRELDKINNIPHEVQLNLTVENIEAIDLVCGRLTRDINAFIKIDAGYHRTGIDYDNFSEISTIISRIEKTDRIKLLGFLIHSGQTYNCHNRNEVLAVHYESLKRIKILKNHYTQKYPDLIVSYGDTPSCSIANDFSCIDEIRPGNFVYYDLMQEQIGSCSLDEIAVAVACPIVAKHHLRKQIVIHGGAVHFSKEYMMKNGRKIWGKAVHFNSENWEVFEDENNLISLSQEHGILEIGQIDELDNFSIGDLVFLLPVHSCLAANLLKNTLII